MPSAPVIPEYAPNGEKVWKGSCIVVWPPAPTRPDGSGPASFSFERESEQRLWPVPSTPSMEPQGRRSRMRWLRHIPQLPQTGVTRSSVGGVGRFIGAALHLGGAGA